MVLAFIDLSSISRWSPNPPASPLLPYLPPSRRKPPAIPSFPSPFRSPKLLLSFRSSYRSPTPSSFLVSLSTSFRCQSLLTYWLSYPLWRRVSNLYFVSKLGNPSLVTRFVGI